MGPRPFAMRFERGRMSHDRIAIAMTKVYQPLLEALVRMIQLPDSMKRFVILEDTITDKFVQFFGGSNKPITIDLPTPQLEGISDRAHAYRLIGMLYVPKRQGLVPSYQKGNLSPEAAVVLGLRVMKLVHRLPDCAQLQIVEDRSLPESQVN